LHRQIFNYAHEQNFVLRQHLFGLKNVILECSGLLDDIDSKILMLSHPQGNLLGHWPFLSAKKAENQNQKNEAPIESIQNIRQLEKVPINKQ